MDERILKSSVQSIEMPEEMKERIINNCKSGEAKPLILPKKRFPIATAATACVSVLAVALAGVGLWQAGGRGSDISIMPNENGTEGAGVYVEDISDDVINIIPLTNEDVEAAQELVALNLNDYEMYRDEQLADYYGIDLTSLSGIFPDVMLHWGPENPDGKGVYSTDNGIYFDKNTYLYTDERTGDKSFQITASRLGIPNSVEKLWSDEEMLSRIDGTTVAIGGRQYMTVYEAEFSTSAGTYFHITAVSGIDELRAFITTIIEKTEQYLHGIPLTLDKLLEICSGDCSKLGWSDFERYESTEIGSGLYILQYIIEDKYTLAIGGVPDEESFYMIFSLAGADDGIDIREESVEDYLAAHADNSGIAVSEILTLEKLREKISSSAKLGWSDFEQYACTETGASCVIRRYDIDGAYVLDISGSLDEVPEHMYFSHKYAEQSERIDLLTQDLNAYLSYYEDKANRIQEKGEKESAYSVLEMWGYIVRDAYGKYDQYGDIPSGEDRTPEQQTMETAVAEAAQAAIAYAAIGKGIDLPKAPVPDTVNVIPVSTVAAATFWQSSIYMENSDFSLHSVMPDNYYDKSYSLLDDYYGITVQPEVPGYMERRNDSYGFYYDESGEVYLDVNVICFVSNEHFYVYNDGGYHNVALTVEVMKDGIPDYSPEFWNRPELLSDINGVTVAIGQVNGVSACDYAVEFMVGDVGFHITSANLRFDRLMEVISSLTGNVKATDTDSGEAEFIFGVEKAIKASATVEEMYRAVEKFDTEGRIDKILISLDGKPVTEGRLVQGLSFEVYYDNEMSWFEFQY